MMYFRGPISVHMRCLAGSIRHYAASAQTIGFVGLGNMGGPMARNLMKAGKKILAYDVQVESLSAAQSAGADVAKSPGDVARNTDTVVTMLPNNAAVQQVYHGPNGILESLKKGTLLIDSSTIDPSISKSLADAADKKGATYVDAPVSGGVNAAAAATLTFMVGSKTDDFTVVSSLLQLMGKNIIHCGAVGSGQAAKICNNMLLAISMVGTAETMNLGIKLGLDAKLLASVLNTSSGRCWSSEVYNPVPGVLENVPSSNNYQGGFGTALMTKDLGLAQDAATHMSVPIPLGSVAHQVYRLLLAQGHGKKDFSIVYQMLQEV